MTEKELLMEVEKRIRSLAVQPPWCENMEFLKKWTEGYETCQQDVIYKIESMMTKLDNKT